MRPILAAALLAAVIIGGLAYGVINTLREDIGIDW